MEGIPTPPAGAGVPAPPSGSLPPSPGAPGAPTPPAEPRRTGLIVGLAVVAALVIGGIAAAVASGGGDGGQAAPSTPASEPSTTISPTPTDTGGGAPAGAIPDEIGGEQRISGAQGDAFEELMRGFAGEDSLAVGAYGTLAEPRFMYIVIGPSSEVEGLPLEAFLNLMAAGGEVEIAGEVATRTEGDVEAACGSVDDPTIGFMCVTIDDESIDLLFGFQEIAIDQQLGLAVAAA
ncbi:MAG TPA: hypothetical protein VE032_08200 [Actinomycetota bacterium]|nr:hypothetical protein [Actinomycetota bacterium]